MKYEKQTYIGTVAIRGKRAVGFVSVPELSEDFVLPPGETGTAIEGDLVEVEPSKAPRRPGKGPEAKLVRVVERGTTEFIGNIVEIEGRLTFISDNKRIHIRPDMDNVTKEHVGKKVVASLVRWEDPLRPPLAHIDEVLGVAGQHETEMQAIIRSGGFIEGFPENVQEAAQELYDSREQIFADAEKDPKRRDMRSTLTFTIDPADAKDFDDALSVEKLEDGNYRIGIHIADVSHYVKQGGPIDKEAVKRGTSIYLVDRVIPMLPEVLSNDLCSLRPGEDRLAFSAVFDMKESGEVVNEWYGQTLIHSDRRFSYEDAQKVIDTDNGDHLEDLKVLMQIGRKLRKKRSERGAIAFESDEVKFELDENKKPVRVYIKERIETMMMIEDFMLLANTEVARHINELAKSEHRNAVFVYRVHDTPDTDRIEELASFLKVLGYELETNEGVVKAEDINKLLAEVDGTPEEALIKTATIRSMAKAVYTTKNIGHFGLAFKFYTHFTSPIRRYPDLMVHRLLRKHLDSEDISKETADEYERISIKNSESEIKAVRAERDSIKYKQVEYMSEHIGETFDAVISGVSDFGIFVQANETKAEGLIRLAALGDDYFENIPGKYAVRGQRTGKKYRLGDPIKVRLTNANLEEKTLDFVIADDKNDKK